MFTAQINYSNAYHFNQQQKIDKTIDTFFDVKVVGAARSIMGHDEICKCAVDLVMKSHAKKNVINMAGAPVPVFTICEKTLSSPLVNCEEN